MFSLLTCDLPPTLTKEKKKKTISKKVLKSNLFVYRYIHAIQVFMHVIRGYVRDEVTLYCFSEGVHVYIKHSLIIFDQCLPINDLPDQQTLLSFNDVIVN